MPLTKPKKKKGTRPLQPERPSLPLHMAIRMFFIGAIAVAGALWAIWRHYTLPPAPMLVPVPAPSESEVPIEYDPTR